MGADEHPMSPRSPPAGAKHRSFWIPTRPLMSSYRGGDARGWWCGPRAHRCLAARAALPAVPPHRLPGVAPREAVGLRWEDVHFAGRSLTVTQQVVQLGWVTGVGEPKTDTGTPDGVTRRRHASRPTAVEGDQEGEARAWGAGWTDSGLVFTREDGSGLHVTDLFQAVSARAGL